MRSHIGRVVFAAALLHSYFAALSTTAPTTISLAKRDDLDLGFQPGTCHAEVTQIQDDIEDGSPNLVQVSIVDDWGQEIGSCLPTNARNTITITSALPHNFTIRTQEFDDPILFEYQIQSWTTDAKGQDYWLFAANQKCSVGTYLHGRRLIDCQFRCP